MSAREIADVFTPSAEEVEWARDKTTAPPNMLALVAWLKSFQYLGYIPGLDEVPEPVLTHIRGALGLSEDVPADVDADRTGKRYREITRLRLGVKSDKAVSRDIAEAAVRAAAEAKDNPADLINVAIEQLVRKRLELPATPRWTGWSPGSAPRLTRACSARSPPGSRLTAGPGSPGSWWWTRPQIGRAHV